MADQWWALFDLQGTLKGQVCTKSASIPPSADGSNPDRLREIRIPRAADPMVETVNPDTGAITINKAGALADVQIDVNTERRRAIAGSLTEGWAIAFVYACKRCEWVDYKELPGNSVMAISLEERRTRWPFAMAEVDLTGDTLATVMARFAAGIAASIPAVAALEAKAQLAKRTLKVQIDAGNLSAAKMTARDWKSLKT